MAKKNEKTVSPGTAAALKAWATRRANQAAAEAAEKKLQKLQKRKK